MTSTPWLCSTRRMMLIDASCPSNRLAAVTNRTGWTGVCSSGSVTPPDYFDFQLPAMTARREGWLGEVGFALADLVEEVEEVLLGVGFEAGGGEDPRVQ